MRQTRILANLLILGAGQVVTSGLSLAYLVLIGRYLGPARLGELTFVGATVSIAGLVLDLGLNTLITRTIARVPDRAGAVVSTAMLTRGALAIPLLAVLYIYAHVAHFNTEMRLLTYIFSVGQVAQSLNNVLLAAFQGYERMSYVAIGEVMRNGLLVIVALVIIRLHAGVVPLAASILLLELMLLALYLRWVRRHTQFTRDVTLRNVRELVVGSLAFWATGIFMTIYTYIDAVILGGLAGSQAVGFYTPATQVFGMALFLPTIVGTATLPLLSRLGVEGGDGFLRANRKTLALLIAWGMPLAVGLATFAEPLLTTIYGPAYAPSGPVLVLLSLSLLPMFLNIQFAQMLTASDRQWRWTGIMAVMCVVNPLVNVVLIPLAMRSSWHSGALGAALALLVTEILMALYGGVLLRAALRDRILGRITLATLIAGAAQAIVVSLTGTLWPPIGEALGVVAYAVVAVALGAVAREDIAFLVDTVMHRVQRRFAQQADAPNSAMK